MKVLTVSALVCAVAVLSVSAGKLTPTCPAGWTLVDGRCFQYVPSKMAWSRAERNCQSKRGNLASVHSAEEYIHIQQMIATVTHSFDPAWLGGTDCQKEGIWLWSDGSAFNFRHCGGFDNYANDQHCLQMNWGADKCWDDVQCNTELPFVCARKPKWVQPGSSSDQEE